VAAVGVMALLVFISGCGASGGDEQFVNNGWKAVHEWMDGVAVGPSGGLHLPDAPPPTGSDLRDASAFGYAAGQKANRSAEEVSRETGIDAEEAKTIYCEFLAEYVEGGEEETMSSWLEEHLESPPERFESLLGRLEEISESTASFDQQALETTSATVCAF
jgi:hypothetical protein